MYVDPHDMRRSWRNNGLFVIACGWAIFFLPFILEGGFGAWPWVSVAACLVAAFGGAYLSKSKGYSPWFGLVMIPFLPMAGTLFLLLLSDKWSPDRGRWLPEPNRFLVGGEHFRHEFEAVQALERSWKAKLPGAIGMALVGFAMLTFTHTFSNYSREVMIWGAWMVLTFSVPVWIWGAKHLARWKGYEPLLCAIGYVLIPPTIISSFWMGAFGPAATVMILAALLIGPVFILLAPKRNIEVKRSPFREDPRTWYLANNRHMPYNYERNPHADDLVL
jgi:hypothetical protein